MFVSFDENLQDSQSIFVPYKAYRKSCGSAFASSNFSSKLLPNTVGFLTSERFYVLYIGDGVTLFPSEILNISESSLAQVPFLLNYILHKCMNGVDYHHGC